MIEMIGAGVASAAVFVVWFGVSMELALRVKGREWTDVFPMLLTVVGVVMGAWFGLAVLIYGQVTK